MGKVSPNIDHPQNRERSGAADVGLGSSQKTIAAKPQSQNEDPVPPPRRRFRRADFAVEQPAEVRAARLAELTERLAPRARSGLANYIQDLVQNSLGDAKHAPESALVYQIAASAVYFPLREHGDDTAEWLDLMGYPELAEWIAAMPAEARQPQLLDLSRRLRQYVDGEQQKIGDKLQVSDPHPGAGVETVRLLQAFDVVNLLRAEIRRPSAAGLEVIPALTAQLSQLLDVDLPNRAILNFAIQEFATLALDVSQRELESRQSLEALQQHLRDMNKTLADANQRLSSLTMMEIPKSATSVTVHIGSPQTTIIQGGVKATEFIAGNRIMQLNPTAPTHGVLGGPC